MKNKAFLMLLGIMAGIIGSRFLLGLSFAVRTTDWICFPFVPIGEGLRALSLQGGAANVAAIIIYILLSICPLVFVVWKRIRKDRQIEDYILIFLSIVLFYALYLMINPGLLPVAGNNSKIGVSISKYLLCVILHSILVAYLVIVAIRRFYESKTENLYWHMQVLLVGCIVFFVFSVVGIGYDEMIQKIREIAEKNLTGIGGWRMTYFFVGLKYAVDSLPQIIGIRIALAGKELLNEMRKDQYSVATEKAVESLTISCKNGLIVMVCTNVIFNGMQFFFVKQLRDISGYVEIPLFGILLALGAMILSRISSENKELKEENDSII